MIRRRLIAKSNLIALCQRNQQNDLQDSTPIANLPSKLLNPESPLFSALNSQQKPNTINSAYQKSESQFSFKLNATLIHQQPQKYDPQANQEANDLKVQQQKQKYQLLEKARQKLRLSEPQPQKSDHKITHRYSKVETISNNDGFPVQYLPADKVCDCRSKEDKMLKYKGQQPIKRVQKGSTTKKRLYQTLNKFKSINLKQELEKSKISKRGESAATKNIYSYSEVKQVTQTEKPYQYQKIQSTAMTTEEEIGLTTKKAMFSHIKKYIGNISPAMMRDQKKIMPEEENDEVHSIILKLATNQNQKFANAYQRQQQQQQSIFVKPEFIVTGVANKKIKSPFYRQVKRIEISYKTTLLQLKQLCFRDDKDSLSIVISLPQVFSKLLFKQSDDQQSLFQKASLIFKELQMTFRNEITIRKYCNCVMILADPIAIISYFSGRVYLGGWQNGGKNGLGLEWMSGKMAYYGQHSDGKRNGYGVMRDKENGIFLGEWRNNYFLD